MSKSKRARKFDPANQNVAPKPSESGIEIPSDELRASHGLSNFTAADANNDEGKVQASARLFLGKAQSFLRDLVGELSEDDKQNLRRSLAVSGAMFVLNKFSFRTLTLLGLTVGAAYALLKFLSEQKSEAQTTV